MNFNYPYPIKCILLKKCDLKFKDLLQFYQILNIQLKKNYLQPESMGYLSFISNVIILIKMCENKNVC